MNADPAATRRRRTARFGAVAIIAALVTSACGAGRVAQTANQVPAQDGVNATVRTMSLRGLAIFAPTNVSYFRPGSAVAMRLVLVNNAHSTDTLTSITSPSAGGWGAYRTVAAGQQVAAAASASVAGSPAPATSAEPAPTPATSVAVEAGSRTSFGVPDATGSLLLLNTKGRLYPGDTVTLTFSFTQAGPITVAVPIQLSDTPGQLTIQPSPGGDSG